MNLENAFPLTVSSDGQRLDQFLAHSFPEISRSRWSRLIAAEIFWVDGQVGHAALRLKAGARIECPEPGRLQPAAFSWEKPGAFRGPVPKVLKESADYLVIDKPAGLTVHPGSGVGVDETLVGWLLQEKLLAAPSQHLHWGEELLEEARPGIVHRLDRGTSGVMVVARNPAAHGILARQFSERQASRLYWAVVEGRVETLLRRRPQRIEELFQERPSPVALRMGPEGVASFVSYLERDPASRTRFRLSAEVGRGKKAVTHFAEVSRGPRYSLVELKLGTGRTHQIRVHLAALGFPLLGDKLYGGKEAERIFLHAHELRFFDPQSGHEVRTESSWPLEARNFLELESLHEASRAELAKLPVAPIAQEEEEDVAH